MLPLARREPPSNWHLRGAGGGEWGLGVEVPPQVVCPVMGWHSPGRGCHLQIHTRGTYRLILALAQGLFHSENSRRPLCCPFPGKYFVAPILGLLSPFTAPHGLWDKGHRLQCDIEDPLRVEVHLRWDSNWPLGCAPAWSCSVCWPCVPLWLARNW